MADEKTSQPSEFVVKSSINVKSMGDPKKLAANLEHDGDVGLLGTIVGIGQAVNRRADPKGGPDYVGLVGMFAAIPADKTREEVRSTICYLHDAVHNPFAASLMNAKEKDPTAVVRFAVECYVRKGGQAGFTWEFKPVLDGDQGATIDPLAQIRAAVKSGAKALPAPTDSEKEALAHASVGAAPSRFEKPSEENKVTTVRGAARTSR